MSKKTYPVNHNGAMYEVRAETPEEAKRLVQKNYQSMPVVIARKGSTRILRRQNGTLALVSPGFSSTNPEQIKQAIDGMEGGEISVQSINESLIKQYPFVARLTQFVRGAPGVGSYVDEAIGAVAGDDAKAGVRALSGAMQAERPGESLALNLAGGATTGAGVAAKFPQAAGALGRAVTSLGSKNVPAVAKGLAAGATAGAIEGGVYGYGEGTDPASRKQQAGQGSAVGAGVGGALGAATPIVGRGVEALSNYLNRSDVREISKTLGISANAAKTIKLAMQQGGDVSAAMAALMRAGNEGMLADAGPAAQALLDATKASGGEAAATITEAIDQRMSRTNASLTNKMDEVLGAPAEGPKTAAKEIADRTRSARETAYTDAYNQPIPWGTEQGAAITSTLNRVPDRIMNQAIETANELMQIDELPRNQHIMASIADDGTVKFTELPNVMQLDYLKRALQTIAYKTENLNPKTGVLNDTGRAYSGLASDLRDALGTAVPKYTEAVRIGGDKIAEERAFDLGFNMIKNNVRLEDIGFELGKSPSAAQVESAKRGLRTYINETMGNVRSIASNPTADEMAARQVVKAVLDLSSDNARAKIKRLMGGEADSLLRQIDMAAQSSAVKAATATNSLTAQRTSIQKGVENINSPGVIGSAMRGQPVNTTERLIQAITGATAEFDEIQRQKIYQDIAKALTAKQGRSARKALEYIDAAIAGQPLTEAQNRFVSEQISAAMFAGATSGVNRGYTAENQ